MPPPAAPIAAPVPALPAMAPVAAPTAAPSAAPMSAPLAVSPAGLTCSAYWRHSYKVLLVLGLIDTLGVDDRLIALGAGGEQDQAAGRQHAPCSAYQG